MQQLVPGLAERVGELIRVGLEPLRDLVVLRVDAHRQIGREHRRRVSLLRIVRVGDRVLGGTALRLPLLRARGTLGELPLVSVQVLEEAVVPLRGIVRPGTLESARDRVGALAAPVGALPADLLMLVRGRLGLRTDVLPRTRAVGLAERVAADDQRRGFLVVHRHARERLADVAGRRLRIGFAARSLGVHVDEAHLHGADGALELTVARVALVAEPRVLRSPEDLLGLPHVLAAEAEAEGLEAHRLERDVAGVHEQIGPRDLLSVLLFHRPEESARLVEVRVVGPAVQRSEALLARAAAAATVRDPVRARGMPGHADEERSVVPVVGGPPVLRRCHHVDEVALQRRDVELGELLRVVEALVERIGCVARVLLEHREVELVRPPVLVRVRPALLRFRRLDDWVFALAGASGVIFVGHGQFLLAEGRVLSSLHRRGSLDFERLDAMRGAARGGTSPVASHSSKTSYGWI